MIYIFKSLHETFRWFLPLPKIFEYIIHYNIMVFRPESKILGTDFSRFENIYTKLLYVNHINLCQYFIIIIIMNVWVNRLYLQDKSKKNLKLTSNCQIIFSKFCLFSKSILKTKRILDSIKALNIFYLK